jgi:hypothetical protein
MVEWLEEGQYLCHFLQPCQLRPFFVKRFGCEMTFSVSMLHMSRFGFFDLPTLRVFWVTSFIRSVIAGVRFL